MEGERDSGGSARTARDLSEFTAEEKIYVNGGALRGSGVWIDRSTWITLFKNMKGDVYPCMLARVQLNDVSNVTFECNVVK